MCFGLFDKIMGSTEFNARFYFNSKFLISTELCVVLVFMLRPWYKLLFKNSIIIILILKCAVKLIHFPPSD